jgi:hypothetical protein
VVEQHVVAVDRPADRIANVDIMANWLDRAQQGPLLREDIDIAGNGNIAVRDKASGRTPR